MTCPGCGEPPRARRPPDCVLLIWSITMLQNAGGEGGGGLCASSRQRKLSKTGDCSKLSLDSGVPISGTLKGSNAKLNTKRTTTVGIPHTHAKYSAVRYAAVAYLHCMSAR